MTVSMASSMTSLLPAAARCSRDGSSLVPRMLDELEYLACEMCGGLWIPCEQLRIMALRVAGGAPTPRSPQRLEASRIMEGTVRCVCPKAPLMHNVDAMKITLDCCEACGAVWLDGGEIRRVIEHYRGNRPSTGIDFDAFDLFDGADLLLGVFELLGTIFGGLLDI